MNKKLASLVWVAGVRVRERGDRPAVRHVRVPARPDALGDAATVPAAGRAPAGAVRPKHVQAHGMQEAHTAKVNRLLVRCWRHHMYKI